METIKVKKTKREKVARVIPDEVYTKSVYVVVEKAEAMLMDKEVQGDIVDKFVYVFSKDGKEIEGMTYWGLVACAQANKRASWTPVFSRPEYTPLPNGKVILTIECKNPNSKQVEYGNCVFDPNSRFAERTAMTNAKRYALDKHIPVAQKVAFIKYVRTYEPNKILEIPAGEVAAVKPRELTTASGKAPADMQKDIAIKAIFAKIAAINQKHGTKVSADAVKEYLKNERGVAHLADMSLVELREAWDTMSAWSKDKKAWLELEALLNVGKPEGK